MPHESKTTSSKKATALEVVKIIQEYTGVKLAWTDTRALYKALEESGWVYDKDQRIWVISDTKARS